MNKKDSMDWCGHNRPKEDLTDWELICVISYLHQLLNRVDDEMTNDFEMLKYKHFAGDEDFLLDAIEKLVTHYENVYTNRHKN